MTDPKPPSHPDPHGPASRIYDELRFDRPASEAEVAPLAPPSGADLVPPPAVASSAIPGVSPAEPAPSLTRAIGLGSVAATLGALLYYGVRALTGYELGLIAIVVGIAVGASVRIGAVGSTHKGYRVLAVLLSYLSVAATYLPLVITASGFQHLTLSVIVQSFFIALAIPFLMLSHGQLMSAVILAIALWEAWKFSAPPGSGSPKR